LLVAACQGTAPELPPDTTAVNATRTMTLSDFTREDAKLTCLQIQTERRGIANAMLVANQKIDADRTQNQVAGYFLGILYFVPYAAAQGTTHPQKAEVARLYARQDTLIKLASFRRCAAD
jgi:hypothetical protein